MVCLYGVWRGTQGAVFALAGLPFSGGTISSPLELPGGSNLDILVRLISV